MGDYYCQLTLEQRTAIYHLRRAKLTQQKIAMQLGVHKSTISRELKRNKGQKGYRPQQAQRFAEARRQVENARYPAEKWKIVESFVHLDWSPEQIANRLPLELGPMPSHEAIYMRIYEDKRRGGKMHKHLRCQKKRTKRYGSNDRRGKIAGRVGIEFRPDIVEQRRRLGDWEVDLMIGKAHRGAVMNINERKSLLTILAGLETKSADLVADTIVEKLKPHKQRVKTITQDNGQEFSAHQRVSKKLGASIYFSDPNAPWQRGTCENTNGLLRQYFPKSKRLDNLSEEEIEHAEARLNFRPRKRLGWKMPYEVYYDTKINSLDVALRT